MSAAVRSGFVTVIGWLGVLFGALGTAIGALQLVMVATMLPTLGAAASDPQLAQLPELVQWMLAHVTLLVALNLGVFALMLAASIGLLMRRNWARLTVIALLLAGIVANFAGLALQHSVMAQLASAAGAAGSADVEVPFVAMRAAFFGFGLLLAVVIAALHGWIAWKLASPPVRREFGVD